MASSLVWKTIYTAALHHCRVGEESITDFLVLGLKMMASGTYRVDAFTKQKEAVNGADWELWVIGISGKSFGLRIQAKIIDYAKSEYPHLHPKPKSGELPQSQKLINAASAVHATPIYCLYTAWPSGTKPTPKRGCSTYLINDQHYGISVIAAGVVSGLAPTKALAVLSPHMLPFHCLFCPSSSDGHDLPTRVQMYVAEVIDQDALLLPNPPEHINRLMSRLDRDSNDGEYSDEELGSEVSRIVVISESNHQG